MDANTNAVRPVPGVLPSLEQLSDAELLAGTRRLVGRSNQLLAELLAHLGEVEARGIHRTRACSSLYAYCIYELRFSEDEAFRRVAAARLVRRFPSLLYALASGELHLTGLLLLAPHLTETNLVEVLACAKYRTKREIVRLVRSLDPLPAVPARIEPLGPALARVVPAAPTWEQFVQATCPVRELAPNDRPRNWMENANVMESANGASVVNSALARVDSLSSDSAGRGTREALEPERYKVQFTASEEYVRLVEEAKALLSHAVPNVTLEELQLRAMRALVAELRKRKYAAAPRARDREPSCAGVRDVAPSDAHADGAGRQERAPESSERLFPRQRGRRIPAAVRLAVFARDGHCCSYVDARGRQCAETHRLEFHHLRPFARGGEHAVSNLTLRCAPHNALAAEEDFGRAFIERLKRQSF